MQYTSRRVPDTGRVHPAANLLYVFMPLHYTCRCSRREAEHNLAAAAGNALPLSAGFKVEGRQPAVLSELGPEYQLLMVSLPPLHDGLRACTAEWQMHSDTA